MSTTAKTLANLETGFLIRVNSCDSWAETQLMSRPIRKRL